MQNTRIWGRLLGASAALALLAPARPAAAAGLFFSDRGVRPLGRGGAFVAAPDDLGAIWYNPAGLVDCGTQLLIDGSNLNFDADYKRRSNVTDANGTVRTYEYPTVHGSTPVLPLPTIAFSQRYGDNWTFAGGILAPYAPLVSYPATVDGKPSPARYSLVTLDGSALSYVGAYAGYKASKTLNVGFGPVTLVGTFNSTVVLSASPPDRLVAAPEDPAYDTVGQITASPIVAPTLTAGVSWAPDPHIRIGASALGPMYVYAPAKMKLRLPTAAVFDGASQSGDSGTVSFWLPPVIRAGLEYRTDLGKESSFRAEVAYVREFWSVHKSIDVDASGTKLLGVKGFPSPFGVPPLSIPRNFQDANSLRVGAEIRFPGLATGYPVALRAGAQYEGSAVPNAWTSVLSADSKKLIASIGGSLYLKEKWRFDAVFAQAFVDDVTVDPATAAAPRINPVTGNATKSEAINGGSYAFKANLIGFGLVYKWN